MGGSVLVQLATFYLARSMGLNQTDTGIVLIPLTGLVAVGTVISVVPAARVSDRVGRKPVIWASCAIGGDRARDRRGRADRCRSPSSARWCTASRPGSSWRSTGR